MSYKYKLINNSNVYLEQIDIKNKSKGRWYLIELNRTYYDMGNPIYSTRSYKNAREWMLKNHPELLL